MREDPKRQFYVTSIGIILTELKDVYSVHSLLWWSRDVNNVNKKPSSAINVKNPWEWSILQLMRRDQELGTIGWNPQPISFLYDYYIHRVNRFVYEKSKE